MEKDFRLFVKNLPLNIKESDIKGRFEKYLTVNKIDLKEKKDLDDQIHKFAFINVTTTDKKLYTCFGALNGERIDGFEITVELAKESFLERLKREREENKLKQNFNTEQIQNNIKITLPDNLHNSSQNNHKTFFEEDLSADFHVVKRKFNKKHKDVDTLEKQNFEHNHSEKLNQLQKFETEKLNEKQWDESASEKEHLKKKFINQKIDRAGKTNNNLNTSKISQKSEINESERKRLMSLKQKRQIFKAQEQTIRNALKSVDNSNINNKIIFDDDIKLDDLVEKNNNFSKKSKTLFDDDDEDNNEEINWNEEELEAKANIKQKLMKFQTNASYDKRFVLDERFIEDESENEDNPKIISKQKDSEVIDEKQWQLDILKGILGKSIEKSSNPTRNSSEKKNIMVRYDPTANNHQDFEVTIEPTKKEKRVKKKDEKKEEAPPPIPRSEEIFFDIKKIDIGTNNGGFSLLKACDRAPIEDDNDSKNNTHSKHDFCDNKCGVQNKMSGESNSNQNNKISNINFSTKNPFKYDSSDGEYDEETNKTSNKFDFVLTQQENDLLFFTNNDTRFEEAKNFFKTSSVHEEQEFKNKRRGLKEIVRSKIRNNTKKKVPWNKKKILKVKKTLNK